MTIANTSMRPPDHQEDDESSTLNGHNHYSSSSSNRRPPSPTWTDDSAASSSRMSADTPFRRRPQIVTTATNLVHCALYDLGSFIDCATTIACSNSPPTLSKELLNHPPKFQGEYNYAITLLNAVNKLSSIIQRNDNRKLSGRELLSHVERMVIANHHSANKDEEIVGLREALKLLLILSEAQTSVLRKAVALDDDSVYGLPRRASAPSPSSAATSHRSTSPGSSIPHRPSSPSSPKAKLLRALSGTSGASQRNNSLSVAPPRSGSNSVSIGGLVSEALLEPTKPSSSALGLFRRPPPPSEQVSATNVPLQEAQQTINQLLSERKSLKEQVDLQVHHLQDQLFETRQDGLRWQKEVERLRGVQSDDDNENDLITKRAREYLGPLRRQEAIARSSAAAANGGHVRSRCLSDSVAGAVRLNLSSSAEEKNTHSTAAGANKPTSASSPLILPQFVLDSSDSTASLNSIALTTDRRNHPPHSLAPDVPIDVTRRSFESISRQSLHGRGGGAISPAAASSGNNTPSRREVHLPDAIDRVLEITPQSAADVVDRQSAAADDDHSSSTTKAANMDSTDVQTTTGPVPPQPSSPMPSSSSSDEEEEFADTAEQFEEQSQQASESEIDTMGPNSSELHDQREREADSPILSHSSTDHSLFDERHFSSQFSSFGFDRRSSKNSTATTNLTSPSSSSSHFPTSVRRRSRFSLPPQAPKPTSPLPDPPVGAQNSPVVRSRNNSGVATAAASSLQRSSSERGVRRGLGAHQNHEGARHWDTATQEIPVGLGLSSAAAAAAAAAQHNVMETDDENSIPVVYHRPAVPMEVTEQRPVSSSAHGHEMMMMMGMPTVIAEEEYIAGEDDGRIYMGELSDYEPRTEEQEQQLTAADVQQVAQEDIRHVPEEDIQHERDTSSEKDFLPSRDSSIVNVPTHRRHGIRNLFRRQARDQVPEVVAARPVSPVVHVDGRSRGMTASSVYSGVLSADTHVTGSSGHQTGTSIVSTAPTSQGCHNYLKPQLDRTDSLRSSVSETTSNCASGSSSISSERRRRRRGVEGTTSQEGHLRREVHLASLGITSPPVENRSKYNRGSRSRILGHTGSLTNLKDANDHASSSQRRQPREPNGHVSGSHPKSFMVHKQQTNPHRPRATSNVSSQENGGQVSRSSSISNPKPNGGYGYVNERLPQEQEQDQDQESEYSDGDEDAEEEEEEEKIAEYPTPAVTAPTSIKSSTSQTSRLSIISSTSSLHKGSNSTPAHQSDDLPHQKKPKYPHQSNVGTVSKDAAATATSGESRRLKFSKR
ncbi:unnamed protein product [Sympodiomycopsis kandeliae]